jgi:hypothetical protein
LYSMPPLRCCSSVNWTLKSKLKSLSSEDAEGKVSKSQSRDPASVGTG